MWGIGTQATDTPLAREQAEASQDLESGEGVVRPEVRRRGVGGAGGQASVGWREAGGAAEPQQGACGGESRGEGGLWGSGGGPVLTPFNTSSMWSRNCMNRLIFQLVLQFTELTWGRMETMTAGRPRPPGRGPASRVERESVRGGPAPHGPPAQLP